jgi:hypothetical protein
MLPPSGRIALTLDRAAARLGTSVSRSLALIARRPDDVMLLEAGCTDAEVAAITGQSRDIWEEVARIAHANGCVITIYIDDVTLSGDKVPMHVVWEIKRVIHGGGLRYHKEKRAVDRSAEVTGVILNKGEMLPPNRVRRKRRALERAKHAERRRGENRRLMGQLAGLKGHAAQITSANAREATPGRPDRSGGGFELEWSPT